MKNIKIACIADLHIGALADIKSYYEKELVNFLSYVREKSIDLVVVCGDLFDKRIIKDSNFDIYANLFVNELANIGCKAILIKGTISHDYNQLNSYLYLQKQGKVTIINTTQEMNILGMNVLFIPEEYENDKRIYYKDTVFNPEKKYDFVFGHGMFTFAGGYVTESGRNNHIVFETKDFTNNVYGKVVFGHIHIHMEKDNVIYVSSYSRDSFGEEEPKGFMSFEYNVDSHKIIKESFIENENTPKFITIDSKNIPEDIKEMELYLMSKLENVFRLRVMIKDDITETKYNNLLSISYKYNNIVIKKKMKGFSKKDEEENDEIIEKKREERKSKLAKYENMSFYDVTRTIAKEMYSEDYTNEEINKAMS